MLVALTLGLLGSLGHCVGMCSAVVMLVKRHHAVREAPWGWVWVHLGRIASYGILGFAAGSLGQMLEMVTRPLHQVQGAIALLAGAGALYFAFAIVGWAPPPENYFGRWMSRWGRAMRGAAGQETEKSILFPLYLGMLWGLLPCGLVMTALFTAAVSTGALPGALRMVAFGLGTLPALVVVTCFSQRRWLGSWMRYGASALMVLFGMQLLMRGLASWGIADHLMVRGMMLW